MSLKGRIKKKVHGAYDSVKDFKGGIMDKIGDTGNRIGDAAKRTGEKARAGYQRYKDPLIIGASTIAGGIVGSIIPGIGTVAGAMAAGSLASGAVGAKHARKQEQETKKAEKEFNAQAAGLEAGGLTGALRRRRLQRGAGDAVASYESDTTRPGYDEQEVAA